MPFPSPLPVPEAAGLAPAPAGLAPAPAGVPVPPWSEPTLLAMGEEVVAGRRPVEEAFAARREAHRLLVVPQRRAALQALVLHATTLRIPVVEVEGGTLTAICGFDGHQGIALVVGPRRWATLEDVLARAAERHERPFLLALDSLEDPHNFGSLLRTAEAAGVHGVLFPTRRAAPLTPSAVKASAGAVEHLLLVPVDDLAGALADLRALGLQVVGAEAQAALAYRDADLRGALALVVGGEGQGLSGAVRRRLDLTVSIPMSGRIASLNAAVAGSVLLLEAAGQRAGARPGALAPARPAAAPSGEAVAPAPTAAFEPPPAVLAGAPARPRRRRPATAAAPGEEASTGESSAADAGLLPGEPEAPA